MKKLLSLLLVLALCMSFSMPTAANASTVAISKAKATMEVDSTLKLKIIGSNSSASWKTSRRAVATVDKTGLVTAKSEGSATITATLGLHKLTCAIKVVDSNKKEPIKTYNLGETWTVDGLWSLTFDSVVSTDERNQYSDDDPAQVIILTYSYENLGYTSDIQDLYISSVSMNIVDEKGEVAKLYALNTKSPSPTQVGSKCRGAQEAMGLYNKSEYVTVTVELYDDQLTKHKATFKLKVD